MCEQVRSSVLATVAEIASVVAGSKVGRVGLVVASLVVAGWFWPLVVGVGAGVLVSVAGVGYVLGASRERPLPFLFTRHRHDAASQPAACGGERDADREITELTRQVQEARAVARAALLELHELGAVRGSDPASVGWLAPDRHRALPGAVARDEEG